MSDIKPATAMQTIEAYRAQVRFRAVVDSIVGGLLADYDQKLRRIEEEGPYDLRRVFHDAAIEAAARVLQTVYENDGELKFWKDYAEKVAAQALEISYLSTKPPTMVLDRR